MSLAGPSLTSQPPPQPTRGDPIIPANSRSDGGNQVGTPLPNRVRSFMEPRFGFDFSRVRVHTGSDAIRMSHKLNAQAFTQNQHIYFGAGKSPDTNSLTAHELTHVVQQAGGRLHGSGLAGSLGARPSAMPDIQRVLEVRRPGPHDASAFDRRQELIDRLNAQSAAIQYFFNAQDIEYTVIDSARLTEFDRRMQHFIDRTELVPMRLTTGADRVGTAGNFSSLMDDSFAEGNVDLDDLLADDDYSFRSDLVHFLTERFSARNYARRMGSGFTHAEFTRGHRLGKEAEAAVLQDLFHDPSIQFNYEESKPDGTWLNNFVSHDHHYQVLREAAVLWFSSKTGFVARACSGLVAASPFTD